MLKRTVSALIGMVFIISLVIIPNAIPMAAGVALVAVLGVYELYKGAEKIDIHPIWWLGMIATVVCVFSAVTVPENTEELAQNMLAAVSRDFPLPDETANEIVNALSIHIQGFARLTLKHDVLSITPMFPLMITGLLFLGFLTEFFRQKREPLKNISITLFGAVYVGWLLSHLVMLKCFCGQMELLGKEVPAGNCLVMLVLLCTWATDTFAFFAGKRFGRHKLSPQSSPNKTWEGSIGGWAGSVILACITGYFIHLPFAHALFMGAVFGIVSQMGDLTESAIKREIGIKDFGNLIPGHGGVLDRIDSILFTAPFAYYYIMLFLPNYM
ncbi:MAG: phosphatidate cytidylyltransferase [Abditibacteriota bacterium]|nr:phosphatidate cytidylyltransferase [Abditibacteriota bacterium]